VEDLFPGYPFVDQRTFGLRLSVLSRYSNCLVRNVAYPYLSKDVGGLDNEKGGPLAFADCVFFSVQTMETIGYGRINPLSYYVNIVACIEAYLGVIMWATFSGTRTA